MTTKQKSWVYVKSFDETQYIPSSDPDKESLVNYSFANAGLIVGVKGTFWEVGFQAGNPFLLFNLLKKEKLMNEPP